MIFHGLPPELLSHVFELAVEDSDAAKVGDVVCSLSLVDKRFSEIMEPFRFRSLTVMSPVRLKELMDALDNYPSRRGYVRELHFQDFRFVYI